MASAIVRAVVAVAVVGSPAVVAVVAAVGAVVAVIVVGSAAVPSVVVLLALLRAECQLLLELLYHGALLLHLRTQFWEALAEILNCVLRGCVALRKIFDDAVDFFVRFVCYHATVHVTRNLLKF